MKAILAVILLVLLPILIGILFLIVIGGPIYLTMKGFEKFMYFVVNPIIAKIRQIPLIGKLLCFIITISIGLPLVSVLIFGLCIPVICIIAHAITGGNI